MKNIILLLAVIGLSCTCTDKEEPIPQPNPINVNDSSTVRCVDIKPSYPDQVFFSLQGYSEVSRNQKTDWDLGIRFSGNEPFIFLNSSRSMKSVASSKSFEETTQATGWFRWDQPEGHFEGYRIGYQLDQTFIIDLGYNEDLTHIGYKKIILTNSSGRYILKSANLDGSKEFSQSISPISETEFMTISLDKSPTQIYPRDSEWDILFTNYTHEFDSITPYLVAGALINPMTIEVAKDSTSDFEDITLSATQNMTFLNYQDAIGYDWKEYFINEGYYLIYPNKIYIIKKADQHYKLRFLDFYNDQGKTGQFKFEIQKL